MRAPPLDLELYSAAHFLLLQIMACGLVKWKINIVYMSLRFIKWLLIHNNSEHMIRISDITYHLVSSYYANNRRIIDRLSSEGRGDNHGS